MNAVPKTHYIRTSDGIDVAYQVFGEGSLDLVLVPQILSHLEYEWEHPNARRFFERLGSFARVIRFDKRGTGMSDRIGDVAPTVDQRLEDIRAVMGAAASEQSVVMGTSEGGSIGAVFAATYPERTQSLILCAPIVRFLSTEDLPVGFTLEGLDLAQASVVASWDPVRWSCR